MDESTDSHLGLPIESGEAFIMGLPIEADVGEDSPIQRDRCQSLPMIEARSVADLIRDNSDAPVWQESAWEDCQVAVRPSRYLSWKIPLDRALGVLLSLLSLPLIGLLVLLVRMTSPGPGIYRQRRVGKGGRIFSLYKIRTMRQDAEDSTGPVWSQRRDPRATAVGSWLRALHLDELPQTLNVARGEMALIGPRPERPEFVGLLHNRIPRYLDRLTVLPGITGLAQVNLPADETVDGVQRKLTVDLEYIRDAGPVLDGKIVASTLLRLIGHRATWPAYARQDPNRDGSVEAA
jgi:lipopolysaccharide/colanic/teichoic acid biosynthesis glycosyltransferase